MPAERGERPLIGISAWLERVRWDSFEEVAAVAEASFVDKLAEVGASSVILPVQPYPSLELIRGLDGLVLTGGPDVQEAANGTPGDRPPRPEVDRRDAAELGLVRVAIAEEIPVLGVCRGCELLNVHAGGTLVGEVTDRFEGVIHTRYVPESAEPFEFAQHQVEADPDSPVGRALGERFEVLSSHHQAIDEVAPGFRVAARAPDGLIEAIYLPDHPFAVGIQWHPEAGTDPTIFGALVEAARRRKDRSELPNGLARNGER